MILPPLVKEGWGGFAILGRGSNLRADVFHISNLCLNPIESGKRFEPHTPFFLNKIIMLQGALGKNLLLTNRAMKQSRGT